MPTHIEVPFGDNAQDTAILLLAGAAALNMESSAVKTGSGVFIVPKEVAQEAGLEPRDEGEQEQEKQEQPEPQEPEQPEQPKRRPATKKAAKKKVE